MWKLKKFKISRTYNFNYTPWFTVKFNINFNIAIGEAFYEWDSYISPKMLISQSANLINYILLKTWNRFCGQDWFWHRNSGNDRTEHQPRWWSDFWILITYLSANLLRLSLAVIYVFAKFLGFITHNKLLLLYDF